MIKFGVKSDKGKKRQSNEDSYFVLPNENVYMVADGVGGNNSGEVASSEAVTTIAHMIKNRKLDDLQEDLIENFFKNCIKTVNEKIFSAGKEDEANRGMATTLIICYVRGNTAYFMNIGDSRAYLYREGNLDQITEDHTYVNTLLKLGVITEEQMEDHQKGHVITRALGADEEVEPDFYKVEIEDKDIFLLCSDGLYGEVKEKTIVEIIEREKNNMQNLTQELIFAANRAGGRDNITALGLWVTGGKQNG